MYRGGARLAHRRATLRLAEPFRISRETSVAEESCGWRSPTTASAASARPSPSRTTARASGRRGLPRRRRELLGDDPFALEAIAARLAELPGNFAAKSSARRALHDLCGKLVGRPTWRLLGLDRRRAADLVDDLARRPGRHGAPRGEGRPALPAPEAEARRPRRARRRTGAAVRGVTGLPLQVDVNEYWELDEALEAIPSSRPSASSTSSSRCRRRRGRGAAEAGSALPSTSTRTCTRSRPSPRAPSGRTGSTSSSPRAAAFAKRSA